LPETHEDSANRVLTILKVTLNHALDRGRVKNRDAWKAMKPYRGTTSARVRFLTPEEQVRLVNACPGDFRRLVIAALHTGARYGELGRLQAKDFNPEAGTLWIAPGKTDKRRHVVLTPEGQEYFSGIGAPPCQQW
jgi:integrase